MEHSNYDLRQKIDTLQNELSTLESQMKGEASSLETRLLKEKEEIEERLLKEKAECERRLKKEFKEMEKRLTKEKLEIEENLTKETMAAEERLNEVKETFERNLSEEKVNFEELLRKSKDYGMAEVAAKEKCFTDLTSKYKSAQQEVEGLRNCRELQLQEWQNLERDINILLQDGVSNQERSRILDESASGVQMKIKTLYQVKIAAIKELSSLKENYKALVVKNNEKKEKNAEYSSINKNLEEKLKNIEQTNEALSNQLLSSSESNSNLEATVTTLQTQLMERMEASSKYDATLNEIFQVVNSIPHLPPLTQDSRDVKSVLLFLATEIDNLKKQLLEEITNNEELNEETKDLKDNFLLVKQSLTESETENNYLCSKLGETEEKLRLLQEEIQAKLSKAKTAESQTIHDLITEEGVEESINQCKAELHKEYEENLTEMRLRHEAKEKEIENKCKVKTAETIKEKEREIQLSIDQLTEQWSREKSEVERLTQVASVAFKSGTDSMDLLKKQVVGQRKELDDIKRNHKKEIRELQALLEVKKRLGRGSHGEVKLGGTLEDAAEFEYLKNILHQYMLGKETQTLSKVLCAVVKFSKEQQRQVIEYEENKQSLLRSEETLSSQADNNEQIQSESQ